MPLTQGGSCLLPACSGFASGPPVFLFQCKLGLHPQVGSASHWNEQILFCAYFCNTDYSPITGFLCAVLQPGSDQPPGFNAACEEPNKLKSLFSAGFADLNLHQAAFQVWPSLA